MAKHYASGRRGHGDLRQACRAFASAKPERRAELLKLLTSFVGKSWSEHGCVDCHFHVSLDDPNMFYFYENWAERSDFDRRIALDYQKDWFAKQGEYLTKPVELRFFEMLSPYDK